MKKVLFVCSLYHPHVGGIETVVTELAATYKKLGVDSVVLTKRWPTALDSRAELGGMPIHRVLSARTESEFVGLLDHVKTMEDDIRADIIHVIGMRRPLPLIALLLARKWGVPLVSTVAGSEVPCRDDPDSLRTWEDGKEIAEPVLLRSDQVTCFSKSLKDILERTIGPVQNAEVLYAGIDTEHIHSIRQHVSKGRYVLSLRRLVESKGIHTLIAAFAEVCKHFPDVDLIIAGDGPEEVRLKTLVASLGLESRVSFAGTIDYERAIGMLKSAVCTVVPSLAEGGGLVNIEAQAAGCPVIASDVGGISEYIGGQGGGFIFKAGDVADLSAALFTVLSDGTLRQKMIKAGYVNAEKFSWDTLAPSYLALYARLIGTDRRNVFVPYSEMTEKLWLRLNQ